MTCFELVFAHSVSFCAFDGRLLVLFLAACCAGCVLPVRKTVANDELSKMKFSIAQQVADVAGQHAAQRSRGGGSFLHVHCGILSGP